MNKEPASGIFESAGRIVGPVAVFLTDALSIAVGAGALGVAVAGVVVLLLDGSITNRARMVDAPYVHPISRVSDDLARLFERGARESGEISDAHVADFNPSRGPRTAPRSPFTSDE